MNDVVAFDVIGVTEVHDNSNPVFVAQEVTLIFTMRNEDASVMDLTEVGATNEIILKRTGSQKKTFAASYVGDGTDGEVKYTTVAADLDLPGKWKAQFLHTKASGEDIPSTVVTFDVLPRI